MGSIEQTKPLKRLDLSPTAQKLLKTEFKYCAGGFEPVPIFLKEGKGSKLYDVDGKEYIDFVAMFSAVNQGHCHPKIVKAVTEEIQKITLSNMAAHTATWGPFAEMMCKRFGYDKICAMISGAEAADTACKTARKWGITKKGISADDVLVLGTGACYHGLTGGVWNLQDPSPKRAEYGLDWSKQINYNPTTKETLEYGNLAPMKACIEQHHARIAAVILEVTHGHLLTFQQEVDYARGIYDLCKKHNILFIADEIRQGCGKTGKFFAFNHLGADCKPDMVTMGKSITGGVYPQSYILGTEDVMSVIGSYESASTFALSPIAVAATTAALEVIDSENLVQRAAEIGALFTSTVSSWKCPQVQSFTNRGADAEIEVVPEVSVRRLASICMHKGLFIYPRQDPPRADGKPSYNGLRLSPAMVISDAEFSRGLEIIKEALEELDLYDFVAGEVYK
ncbi:MAG: hypothetical protein M1834_002643 [Cirrosporium novae-zelandiae]|nr:MAG: hypothetical protein M1834_002643 [Cirrosporium novae-zelandiae]